MDLLNSKGPRKIKNGQHPVSILRRFDNSLYWCWLCPYYSSLIILSTCVNSATVPTFIQEFDLKLTNHLVAKMIHPIPIPILRLRCSGWCATIRAFGPKTGTPSALRWAPFRSPWKKRSCGAAARWGGTGQVMSPTEYLSGVGRRCGLGQKKT